MNACNCSYQFGNPVHEDHCAVLQQVTETNTTNTDATELARLARLRGELEEARVKVETAKAFAIKYAGHRLMLVAQPFRELVNLLK